MALYELAESFADQLCSLSAWNLLFIFCVLFFINWRRTPHPKFPPGPKGLPLVGVVPFLSDQPGIDFKRWSLKYGPVMSVRMGTNSCVILNNFECVNQALVKQGNTFSGRPWVELFCSLTKQKGLIFKNYGEDFKAQKHFALKYLREHGAATKRMETLIGNEGDLFVKYLAEVQNSDNQVDLQHKLYLVTSNIVAQTVFGTREDYDDPDNNKLLHSIAMLIADPEIATRLSVMSICNFLSHVPYFAAAQRKFEGYMRNILNEIKRRIAEHKKIFDKENVVDYIDTFLFEQNHGNRPKEQDFNEEQLTVMCRDFFMAGTDTTSCLLTWLFVIYTNHPDHQKKIDKEINDVLGSSGIVTMSKRAEMPFTCAFILEGMRFRTIIPLAAQHLTIEDVELYGYVIPKNTAVYGNLQGVHFDPHDWPEPEKFDPYRHIDENGKFVNSKKIIPFGIGSRFCLGESMARVEVFMFFVKVLQKFKVRSVGSNPPPLDKPTATAVVSPRECVVKLEARN